VVTVNCQTDGSSTGHYMLHPNHIEKSGKGHSEIPVGGGKSEVWEAFTGLPLSILDNISKDQNETDVRIRQKLSAGLDKAARILNEISELHATSARKESYYSDWWQKKCAQWAHEAKLKVIWDNNPHLPLFGASEILAGRDPFDPANEFSPGAAGANACRDEAAVDLPRIKSMLKVFSGREPQGLTQADLDKISISAGLPTWYPLVGKVAVEMGLKIF